MLSPIQVSRSQSHRRHRGRELLWFFQSKTQRKSPSIPSAPVSFEPPAIRFINDPAVCFDQPAVRISRFPPAQKIPSTTYPGQEASQRTLGFPQEVWEPGPFGNQNFLWGIRFLLYIEFKSLYTIHYALATALRSSPPLDILSPHGNLVKPRLAAWKD